jgi:hypothetical protein
MGPSWNQPSCTQHQLHQHSYMWAWKKVFLFYFICVGGTGVWTWGFTHAKQGLYCLSHTPTSFCSGYFGDGGLSKYLPGLEWWSSPVARFTGVSHQCPVWFYQCICVVSRKQVDGVSYEDMLVLKVMREWGWPTQPVWRGLYVPISLFLHWGNKAKLVPLKKKRKEKLLAWRQMHRPIEWMRTQK